MNYRQPFILVVALSLLISFNYISAWTVPGANPPSGNVDAPINTGAVDQDKIGSIAITGGGEYLRAPSLFSTDATVVDSILVQAEQPSEIYPSNGLALDVNGKIGGTDYCNENGLSCIPAQSLYENRFGGMFTIRTDNLECLTPNAFTGSCTCPTPPFFDDYLVGTISGTTGQVSIYYCAPPV